MRPNPKASLLTWADYYLSKGLCVLPLREGEKRPGIKWKEYQSRMSTRQELTHWFVGAAKGEAAPYSGLVLVCGAISGRLARIDFDDPTDWETVKAAHPDLTKRFPIFRSQRKGGGFGLLFKSLEPMPTLPQKSFPAFPNTEVRGEGSITVLPPTKGYAWLLSGPQDIPVISGRALLDELFHFNLTDKKGLAASVGRSAGGELARLLTETTEGERNGNIVRIASMLRARDIDQDTARAVVENAYLTHWPQEGMDMDEVRETFDKAWARYEHEGVRFTGGGGDALSLGTLDMDDDTPRVQFKRLDEIRPLTEKDVLVTNVVLAGVNGNTLIAAPTKIGKTSLMLDLAISASKGDLVWGYYPVPRALKIALIDQEQKYEQIRANQILMADVIGEPNYDNLMISYEEGGQFDIQHPAALDVLYKRLYAFEPDLVIIDGWGWFVGHQASDPKLVKPALTWMKRLRASLGCATIIIHHFKKAQFSGRVVDHNEFVDQLDKIEGLKRLADQAHTVLGYTPIAGYDTFNLLDGRSNMTKWHPPKTVIDYDHLSVTHRVVEAEEGQALFDPETYRLLWERSQESRVIKDKLTFIMNHLKLTRLDIAKSLGVDKSMVSRWYSGQRNPSSQNEAQLDEMYKEARKPLKARTMPKLGGG